MEQSKLLYYLLYLVLFAVYVVGKTCANVWRQVAFIGLQCLFALRSLS